MGEHGLASYARTRSPGRWSKADTRALALGLFADALEDPGVSIKDRLSILKLVAALDEAPGTTAAGEKPSIQQAIDRFKERKQGE